MINYSKYDNIIFDFDGVVVNSNFIKEKCIFEASKNFCEKDYHEKFIEYFTKHNGVPREGKINRFYSAKDSEQILKKYNDILSEKLNEVELTKDLKRYLEILKLKNLKLFILSGGNQKEVFNILQSKGLENEFVKIMGGPKTKEQNLDECSLSGKSIFIGDSLKDYEVSYKYGLDFIFMYGYTQFNTWEEFFRDKSILMSFKDFSVLTK